MGLLATQGLTRCTRLRLGCEPLGPSCKRIDGGEITCTHAPFDILCQLGEVLDLLFQLVQIGLSQMQGAHRFAQPPRQAQALGLLCGLNPSRLRLSCLPSSGTLSGPPKRQRQPKLSLTACGRRTCAPLALAKAHGRCCSQPALRDCLVGLSASRTTARFGYL